MKEGMSSLCLSPDLIFLVLFLQVTCPVFNLAIRQSLAIFTKDYMATHSKTFWNVLESFSDHVFIYVNPTHDFRIKYSLEPWKTLEKETCVNKVASCL